MSNSTKNIKSPNSGVEVNISSTNQPGHRHEIIQPPRKLGDIVAYRQEKGAVDPVEKAERQIQNLSVDFAEWLQSILGELDQSWLDLKQNTSDPAAYIRFQRAAYTIKGDASILGCSVAGELSIPLTRLLEQTPNIDDHTATFELFVSTICLCTSLEKEDFGTLKEIHDGLETITNRKINKLR